MPPKDEEARPSIEREIEEALGTAPPRKAAPAKNNGPKTGREAEVDAALREAGAEPAKLPAEKAAPAKGTAGERPAPRPESYIDTKIDALCRSLETAPGNELTFESLGKKIGADERSVERVGRVLQERGITEVIYPVSVFAKPSLRLVERRTAEAQEELRGERLLEDYSLNADGVPARVNVWQLKGETRPVYHIRIVKPGPYTGAYLEHLRERLAREVPILTEEITDPKKLLLLKARFHDAARTAIEGDLPELEPHAKEVLAGMLLHRMYGLGVLELLMVDDKLEEVAVNASGTPITVYHKRIGWLKSTLQLETEEEIYNFASQIGRKAGRDISLLSPILDAPLLTGDRATATLFPISSQGNTITIRRFARQPWTPIAFLDPAVRSIDLEMAAFLWQAAQFEQNIIFAGGTATGKTSILNAIAMFIPPANRIITVEEVRELALPTSLKWNWVPFVTRGANPEGKGEVSMLDLMVTSLRMRPDRIIVGEVRRAREAEVLFEAMHTGHAVYSTLHADNAQQAVRRLLNPPINVPATELETLQLFVVQYRDRRTGVRRTSEITEVVPGVAGEINLHPLYRWRARTDTFERMGDSVRVVNELSAHTGMSLDEIREDRANKERILEWMIKGGLRTHEQVGSVMNLYYRDPGVIESAAARNLSPEKVL
jgi:flagellar protein FlaI